MNKIFSSLAIIILILTFSCDSAGSSSDSETALEAAGALAAAGAVMGADDYSPPVAASPPLASPPLKDSPVFDTDEYVDDYEGIATITYSDPATIDFDNFHASYNDNQYILNGLIADCTYSFASNTATASFAGDVTIEGGSLSGLYTVDIDVALGFSYDDDNNDIIIAVTVTGNVNGESVDITYEETIHVIVIEIGPS